MNLIYAFLLVPLAAFFFWVYPIRSAATNGNGPEKQFNRVKFWETIKNVRWIQITIHAGLILAGAGLGAFYFPANLPDFLHRPLADNLFAYFALANLVLAFVFAWLASVFLNDIVDLEIDKVTNVKRPTVTGAVSLEEYRQLFWACFVMSLILGLTVGMKFFLIVLAYQIIGWVYSCPPFRLKRFPGIATIISALALSLLFLSGFMLLADNQDILKFPVKIFSLLMVAFAVSLPIKDLKDIAGDKKNGIWTIPVVFGEVWARFLIGLGIFISYALSVVWINAKILFFPAMILGAISFWILQTKKIPPRRVHIFVFGLLFLYVISIFLLVFYPTVKIN